MVRARQQRRDVAVLRLRQPGLVDRAGRPVALPGHSQPRIAGPGGAGREFGRRDGRGGRTGGRDTRNQHRLVGRVVSGTAFVGPGAAALCAVAAGRVPVPCRALRELVDPAGGAAGDPARAARRGAGGDVARAGERRLSADRPAHHDGPGRQERHPDDRIRRTGRTQGRARRSTRPWKRRASACARS